MYLKSKVQFLYIFEKSPLSIDKNESICYNWHTSHEGNW